MPNRTGSGVFLDLLNFRSVSLDPILGSPAQRLMSRQTRTAFAVVKQFLRPHVRELLVVQARLQHKGNVQKGYYNKTSSPLQQLSEDQVVRLQTAKGYDCLDFVDESCTESRSYL